MARVYKFAQKEYGISAESITLKGLNNASFTFNGQPVMGQGSTPSYVTGTNNTVQYGVTNPVTIGLPSISGKGFSIQNNVITFSTAGTYLLQLTQGAKSSSNDSFNVALTLSNSDSAGTPSGAPVRVDNASMPTEIFEGQSILYWSNSYLLSFPVGQVFPLYMVWNEGFFTSDPAGIDITSVTLSVLSF